MTIRATVVFISVLVLAACSSSYESPPQGTVPQPLNSRFGHAPVSHPGLRYQPDVVLIPDGPSAIRSITADRFVWVMNPDAPGISELAVGKIMFASSRAVGRVHRLETRAEGLAVTLAPVSFTEVVRDGLVNVEMTFDVGELQARQYPDLLAPGGLRPLTTPLQTVEPRLLQVAAPESGGGARTVSPKEPDRPPAPEESLATKNKVALTVKDFDIEIAYKQERENASTQGDKRALSLGVVYKGDSSEDKVGPGKFTMGLKFGGELTLYGRKVKLKVILPVHNGVVDQSAAFVLSGFEEIGLAVQGGAGNGVSDNTKLRVELPVELTMPIPPEATGGIPLVFQFKFKFLLTTAFSSKNSTLQASGLYRLKGPIGFEDGQVLAPAFEVVKPIMDSLSGVSIAPNGIVTAAEFRFNLGFGIEEMMAGPYYRFTTALGLSKGSSIALVDCKGALLKIDGGFGVGVQVSSDVANFLEKRFGKKSKLSVDLIEVSKTIVHRKVSLPDIALCAM